MSKRYLHRGFFGGKCETLTGNSLLSTTTRNTPSRDTDMNTRGPTDSL